MVYGEESRGLSRAKSTKETKKKIEDITHVLKDMEQTEVNPNIHSDLMESLSPSASPQPSPQASPEASPQASSQLSPQTRPEHSQENDSYGTPIQQERRELERDQLSPRSPKKELCAYVKKYNLDVNLLGHGNSFAVRGRIYEDIMATESELHNDGMDYYYTN